MKYIYLIAFICSFISGSAQFDQGKKLVGGSTSLGSYVQRTKYGSNVDYSGSVQLSPSFGYFFAKNFVVGLGVSAGIQGTDLAGRGNKSGHLSTFAFTRRYFKVSGKDFYPFIHFSAGGGFLMK